MMFLLVSLIAIPAFFEWRSTKIRKLSQSNVKFRSIGTAGLFALGMLGIAVLIAVLRIVGGNHAE